MTEFVDVVIIGAGISGISAAWHLQGQCPGKSYAILERREKLGGTWDLFKYPGIRSDSDMYTLGFHFKPWATDQSIADGPSIWNYLNEAATENGIDKHIRYNHRVLAANWSDQDNHWELTIDRGGEEIQLNAGFLWACSGYYNYDKGYAPEFPGAEDFAGTVVHPQHWPEDLDYAGKRVVVIGSGATAVTLVPAMAKEAAHVTMLQRSPSYWFPAPTVHDLAVLLEPLDLPAEWTHEILRRQYVQQLDWLATTGRDDPDQLHEFLIESIRPLLPEGTDIEKHFTPSYRPWQQRIAFVPDGDLFAAMREGTVSIVTDTIAEFTEKGVQVSSGEVLEADVIVTATGFNLSPFGDIPFRLDGEAVDFADRVTWRGIMISGVPNMAYAFGYFRHSWTLRVDLVNDVVGRVFARMAERGARAVVPTLRPEDEGMPRLPWSDPANFNPGYVLRSQDRMFRQGDREPWTHMHEHDHDRVALPEADVDDGLEYR
jgi:cation diffusion facilitator CzcD-associated flavoprotein CzcO